MTIKLSRDSWLALGLFVVLTAVTIIATIQDVRSKTIHPPLTSFSTQPDGARAFWLWLDALGYQPSDRVRATFVIPDDTALLLLLEPQAVVLDGEWETIDGWVEAGGTLLVVGRTFATTLALNHYGFDRVPLEGEGAGLVQSPLLASPPLPTPPTPDDLFALQTERTDFVTHLAVAGQPQWVSFSQGAGRVILGLESEPLTNEGLKTAGNGEWLLNLLSGMEPGAVVWFDEWHHGVRPETTDWPGPWLWLQTTAAGRGILFVAGLIFVTLLLRGWPFGRPVPLPQDLHRRAPLEYITAVANLSRQAGHKTAVLQDYHDRLKRHLAQPYRLNPALPDAEFIETLAGYKANLDEPALRSLLARLSAANVGESELVQLAAEVAQWMKK
ncbi:MAG: DUF4350 domain-containing protein [Chloroflexota bacterium]